MISDCDEGGQCLQESFSQYGNKFLLLLFGWELKPCDDY